MNRLKQKYLEQLLPILKRVAHNERSWGTSIEKIVVSAGVGSKEDNSKSHRKYGRAVKGYYRSKPKQTLAKQSIAGFNIREESRSALW